MNSPTRRSVALTGPRLVLLVGWCLVLWVPQVGHAQPAPAEVLYGSIKHDRQRLKSFFRVLPKGGVLHTHLSGELDPDLLIDLASQQGYYLRLEGDDIGTLGLLRDVSYKLVSPRTYNALPAASKERFLPVAQWLARAPNNRTKLRDALTFQSTELLQEFFGPIFDRIDEIGKDPSTQRPLFERVLERAHDQAISYLELRINPRLATDPELMAEYGRIAQEVNSRWKTEESVLVRFVVGVHRGSAKTIDDLRASFQAVAADDRQGDLLVGVDLVGAEEANGAPAEYLEIFKYLKARYPSVHLTLHAGETNEPSSHVRDSILLGAERIGHGTNLALDPLNTMRLARENRVLIEVSLISNRMLLHRPIADHPFWTYLNCGLPVSLNTDDGAIFDSTLTDEFTEAALAFDLTWSQIRQLCENSLRAAFAAPADKQPLIERWKARWDQFEKQPPGP